MERLLLPRGLARSQHPRFAVFAAASLFFWLYPASLLAAPTIRYVQSNCAVPQTPQTTVTVKFNAAQTAGNLSVVVVGWNDRLWMLQLSNSCARYPAAKIQKPSTSPQMAKRSLSPMKRRRKWRC